MAFSPKQPSLGSTRGFSSLPDWRTLGYRYFPFGLYLNHIFGAKTWKVSVDAGFGCPNADGTIGRLGCSFCNIASFSPSRRVNSGQSVREQLLSATGSIRAKRKVEYFIAYFQPATNTYAPLQVLREIFEAPLSVPGVVGIAIGTRPDCLPDETLDYLSELARRTWLSIEIGLQSAHNETLQRVNRRHTWEVFLDAVQRSTSRGLRISTHIMFGLPGETPDQMRHTVAKVSQLPIHAIKIHNLYVAKGTPLAKLYEEGVYVPLDRDQYVELVVDALERIPPWVVIERLTAETHQTYLIAPDWCQRKGETLSLIQSRLQERKTYQGRLFESGICGIPCNNPSNM